MGIKNNNIASFLEPESNGFLYDTARSFLRRHSNPESLLAQIKNLMVQGQLDACRDMIQLVIREGHELGDQSELYLMRAQVAYEQADNLGEVMAWIQQAKHCKDNNPSVETWDQFISARNALREGDISKGLGRLNMLSENTEVAQMAKYEMAHHLFWKSQNTDKAILLLEEVVSERPSFIQALSTLGFAYNKKGLKEKAQQTFGQCIEMDSCPDRLKVYKQQIAS